MEELIDVFLDELIDKKEISQNERTDMKLTLLEAMPNGLNDETKTRVMSTLKSKMETPSANIFTDKGVNIEAVRTIATETVKNVVETVEKETSAREEAEAKRAAKVDDALSQTIAEADEKENIIKEQENVNEKNDDDLYYEDPIYFKVSHKSMQQAYKEIEEEYAGREIDEDLKLEFALSKASYLDYNNLVKKYIEQGKPIAEAISIALLETSDGNTNIIEANRDRLLGEALQRVLIYLDDAIEQKLNLYEYINVVLEEHADEFVGIENLDVLVKKVFEFYQHKCGWDEKYLMGEKDTFEIVEKTDNAKEPDELDDSQKTEIVKASIIKELYDGYGFEEAYKRAMQKYEKYFISLENTFDLVSNLRDSLLSWGFTEEELDNGNIDKKKWDLYVKDNAAQIKESESEQGEMSSASEYTDKVLSVTGIKFVVIDRSEAFQHRQSAADILRKQNIETYKDAINEINKNKDRDGYTLLNKFAQEKRKIEAQHLLVKQNRKLDDEEIAKEELSTERKNLLEQRDYYIKRATKLYMTGEKSVYEILEELGENAVKYEIIPKDIINSASEIIKKNNPNAIRVISSSETTMMYKQMMLEVAYKELDGLKDSDIERTELIENIAKIEREITELRRKATEIKVQCGTFDKDRAIELEQDLLNDIQTSYNLTNKFEKLLEMQSLYLVIQDKSKEKGITMESAAKIIFAEKKTSRELFGIELVDAMNKYDDGESIEVFPIVKESLKRVNDQYKELVEQNISNIDRNISKSIMHDTIDIDCTAAILEKERYSREVRRIDKRDLALTKSNQAFDRKEVTDIKYGYIKQAVAAYYEKGISIADIYETFKANGKNIEPNEIIKGILMVAEKFGVGTKDQHKDFATKELESFNEHLKINAWKSLRKNARISSNLPAVETFDEDIEQSKRIIAQNLQDNSLLRAAVRERDEAYKNMFGVELFENEPQRRLKLAKGSMIVGKGAFKRKNKHQKESEAYGDEQKNHSEQPRRVGFMNVAKVLEKSGTTSQEIVGEVTDLNKFARAQDDRVVDSSEQRDS